MTPFNVFGILFIIQIVGYIFLDKFNLKKWKYLILGLLLVVYIFIIPRYFSPDISDDEIECGMPMLVVTLTIWLLGCGITLITHVIYITIKNLYNSNRNIDT